MKFYLISDYPTDSYLQEVLIKHNTEEEARELYKSNMGAFNVETVKELSAGEAFSYISSLRVASIITITQVSVYDILSIIDNYYSDKPCVLTEITL